MEQRRADYILEVIWNMLITFIR